MLKFADCNIAVGQPNAISGWRIYDSAQIACQAQRCGIQKGLAFCNAALQLGVLVHGQSVLADKGAALKYLPGHAQQHLAGVLAGNARNGRAGTGIGAGEFTQG